MPSSRPASSPRDCSSISPSLLPSSSGTRSGPGCEPFVPVSRHRSLSWQTRCARHFPIFSWVPQKAILSRNSSPSAKTPKICGFSAWPREQKEVLLSSNLTLAELAGLARKRVDESQLGRLVDISLPAKGHGIYE